MSRRARLRPLALNVVILGAADAEGCSMICPRLLGRSLRGVFPPSTGGYDVHAAVTVDISNRHAVPTHEALFRDSVHDTGGGVGLRIGLAVLLGASAAEQN